MSNDLLEFGNRQQQLWAKAEVFKNLRRVELPRLDDWNYDACEIHSSPTPACELRKCGGDFFDHQTKSIGWLYAVRKGLDASVTGAGKTNIALGTLALCKQRGEKIRALIVCQTPAVLQWAEEAARFAPGLKVRFVTSGRKKSERISLYADDWEVLIIGHHLMSRDLPALLETGTRQVISDDVDPILNIGNATHKAMILLTDQADRVMTFNATSLQTRIQQLYAATAVIGGRDVWGSLESFENKFIKRETVYFDIRRSDGGKERKKTISATGYQNLNLFRSKFLPMVIRHSYPDMTDVRLPDIMPAQHVWLDMYPAQRKKYEELQKGVLELQRKDEPPQQKMVSALAAYTHGQQICTGLPALGEEDGPGASIKLDWLEYRLANDWGDRKIVVFARNIGTISALHARLERLSIGYATIWGKESNADHRAAERKRFWEDPSCRVMIGSSAMERSLNLHVSNLIVFLDTIPNPARMTQLIGRIRRAGSVHERVWTFYPLVKNSQEERYMKTLGARQAVIDRINNEDNADLFERLSPEELLRLISG